MFKARSLVSFRRNLFNFDSSEVDKYVTINSKIVLLEAMQRGNTAKSIIPFDKDLLNVLSCPLSGDVLEFDETRNILISKAIGMAFPINLAGMPLLLNKWAIPLEDSENKVCK